MADPIELTLVLRPPEASQAISESLLSGTYDPAQTTAADIAAAPSDVAAVSRFAAAHNLKVLKTDADARSVRVSGSAADIQSAFGIRSGSNAEGSVESLNYKGAIDLPEQLKPIVIAVLGLDQTPIARSHSD